MFDYLFYTRPYDHYLPEIYRTGNMIKFTRCCYISYGYELSNIFFDVEYAKQFIRNLFFVFPCNNDVSKKLNTVYNDTLHHVDFLGYPAFECYFNRNVQNNDSGSIRILWTPRWSYDEKIGGSRFFEYKDTILSLADQLNISVTFRPHPLLFNELVIKGMMTEDEIDSYLQNLDKHGIKYDHGTDLAEALINTDVLISDFSSIVIEFLLTGKPVIYCEAGMLLNDHAQIISEGFYKAYNEEDVIRYVKMLVSGDDPLKDKREKIISEHLSIHNGSSKRIAERIAEDWYGRVEGRDNEK